MAEGISELSTNLDSQLTKAMKGMERSFISFLFGIDESMTMQMLVNCANIMTWCNNDDDDDDDGHAYSWGHLQPSLGHWTESGWTGFVSWWRCLCRFQISQYW